MIIHEAEKGEKVQSDLDETDHQSSADPGVMGGMAPYFLSVFDKQPCTEMGIAWVTEIVAVALGYFVRGFKDTKSEEDTRLREKQIDGGLTFIDLEEEAQG